MFVFYIEQNWYEYFSLIHYFKCLKSSKLIRNHTIAVITRFSNFRSSDNLHLTKFISHEVTRYYLRQFVIRKRSNKMHKSSPPNSSISPAEAEQQAEPAKNPPAIVDTFIFQFPLFVNPLRGFIFRETIAAKRTKKEIRRSSRKERKNVPKIDRNPTMTRGTTGTFAWDKGVPLPPFTLAAPPRASGSGNHPGKQRRRRGFRGRGRPPRTSELHSSLHVASA